MANYLPPTEDLPTFNPSVFMSGDDSLTYNKAKKLFLTYPTAQGTETLQDVNVSGTATFAGKVDINNGKNRLNVDGTQNMMVIDINNSTAPNLVLGTTTSNTSFISGGNACSDSTNIKRSVIIGDSACTNRTGYNPTIKGFNGTTAIGYSTLNEITPDAGTLGKNTAIGSYAGAQLQGGNNNTYVGADSGNNFSHTANYCTFIGGDSGFSGPTTYTNSSAIGYGAKINDNHQIQLGTINEYVNIPNYIKFPDGTTQNTAAGGGGGSGVNTSNTLTGHPYTSAGSGSGATIGGTFTGSGMTAYGVQALKSLTTGTNNVGIGSFAGKSITDGSENVIVGENSGYNIASGQYNTIIGCDSGNGIGNESNNIIIGSYSDTSPLVYNSILIGNGINGTSSNKIYLGQTPQQVVMPDSFYFGSNPNKIQKNALASSATGTCAPYIVSGDNSVPNLGLGTTGTNLCAYGVNALQNDTTGSFNTAIGSNSLKSNTTGSYNNALGELAGNAITTGTRNICIGYNTGSTITTGSNNTLIGHGANVGTSGTSNSVAIGSGATTTASNQIMLGTASTTVKIPNVISFSDGLSQQYAYLGRSSASYTVLGNQAGNSSLNSSATGSQNTLIGAYTGTGITSGSNNSFIGEFSGRYDTTGSNNTGVCANSLGSITTGNDNTALGYNSGFTITTENNNVCIGSGADISSASITNSVALGKSSITNESNQIQLGTTSQYVNIPSTLKLQNNVASSTTSNNVLNNTSMTITGSSSGQTNTKTSLLDTITNGLGQTLTSGLISSVPTFKAIDTFIGASTFITPNNISVYPNSTTQTTNKATLQNTQLQITGGTTTQTNTKTSLLDTITDGTATALSGLVSSIPTFKALTSSTSTSSYLTPSSLSLYSADNAQTVNKNSINSSGMRMIGSLASTISNLTNGGFEVGTASGYTNITPAYNLLALTSSPTASYTEIYNDSYNLYGASASIYNRLQASLHTIANTSNSSTLGPDQLNIQGTSSTINKSQLLSTALTITGSVSTTSNTANATNNILSDATNSRYIAMTSGGYASSGNSINNTGQVLYMGSTAPSAAAAATPGMILTPTILTLCQTNNERTNSANVSATTGFRATNGATSVKLDPNTFSNPLTLTGDYYNPFSNTVNTQVLTSSSSTTGSSGSVGISFVRTKSTATTGILAGDMIGQQSYWANAGTTGSPNNVEFARQSVSVKNVGVGNNDGAILFQTAINGTLTNMLELNGDEQQINALQPIDTNNNSIVSSTGNITIDASSSSGTGAINLTTKNGTAGSGAGLVLTGNTLTASTAGGSSGLHLCLTINGTVYKIPLLNA